MNWGRDAQLPAFAVRTKEKSMRAYCFTVERIEVESEKSFEDLAASIERRIPVADLAVFDRLVGAGATAEQIQSEVQSMTGDLGFVMLGKIDQGPLVSLLGKPKKMSTYLIGNPVLANRMYERHPAVGLYAPLRASIYQDQHGKRHFTYDRPSTLLAQFEDGEIRAVAEMLDEKMANLADDLAKGEGA